MTIQNLVSFAGLFLLCGVAWLFSTNRRNVNWRLVGWGIALQLAVALLVFKLPAGTKVFLLLNDAVVRLQAAALEGARFCFGPLAAGPGEQGSVGFILLFQGLATVIFFAALMQLLYYTGVMPWLLRRFAALFSRLMNVSGAESLCTASNIFVGVESTTTVTPFLARMTPSEICTVLTAGMATIASTMLGLYVSLLHARFPAIAGHLISASIMSAPAALVMAKLLVPEDGEPETRGRDVAPAYEREGSWIEAVMAGATNGGRLLLGIVVMLMAFLGLLALANALLGGAGGAVSRWTGMAVSLRLEDLLAYAFYPLATMTGVTPSDAWPVAKLLGERLVQTEIPAYQHLDEWIRAGVFHDPRSAVLACYALCGFAHIPSVAVFAGGVTALAPNQRGPVARVAFRALFAATLACLMTSAAAGVFCTGGSLLLPAP